MSRTKLSRERQQHGPLTALRRITGLGAFTLLQSGCGATHSVSQGDPTIESSALCKPQPFTRLAPRTYTLEVWPQALRADVYLPANNPNGTLRSAALVVDEGGWRNRTPEDMQGIAEQLAGQGYVAVNIEHRFAPEYRFPNQLHNLQQAMAWIHTNAEEWQVDTRRPVGDGFSFGAHIVSLLALAGGLPSDF